MKKYLYLLFFYMFCFSVYAQVPGTISYQGFLTDPDSGDPVENGDYNITFKFYDNDNAVIATRGPIITPVMNGLFTVLIGGGTAAPNLPLPVNIWNQNYTVGITIGEDAEIAPRIRLTSVPYAFQAETANSIDGTNIFGNIAAGKLSGTIDNARLDADLQDLADGILSGDKIGSGIDASNIISGTLDNSILDTELQDLADGSLSGNLIGTGINATNITGGVLSGMLIDSLNASILKGTIDNERLNINLQDLADGSLSGNKVGAGIDAAKITTNNLTVANGGTGASTAINARSNLGLTIGSEVQAYDLDLDDLSDGSLSGSKIGSGIDAANITVSSVALENGGTNANNALDARTNLGLAIGADIQAYNINLADLADGSLSGNLIGPGISAGNITGSFNVNQGGTGATTLTGALFGNGISPVSGVAATNGNEYLRSNSGNTAYEFGAVVVSGSEITDGSVNSVDLANSSVSGGAGGVITDNTITSNDLANSSVSGGTGGIITDGSITTADLANNAVTGGTGGIISDGSITSADLANGSVSGGTGGKITDGTVTNADISASASINGTKINPGFGSQNITTTGSIASTAGIHVGGTNAPSAGNLEVDGYTQLGSASPAIQVKTILGSVSGTQGAETVVSHGLGSGNPSKILSVSVLVEVAAGSTYIPPGFTFSTGFEYNYYVSGANIRIATIGGNSDQIVSKSFRIVITYEQ